MNDKKYILKTNFDFEAHNEERIFEKELELLCARYNVDLDYEYIKVDE